MKATVWMSGLAAALVLSATAAHADDAAPKAEQATVTTPEKQASGAAPAVDSGGADSGADAAPADAQVAVTDTVQEEATPAGEEAEEAKSVFPIGATIIYENSLGIGTFVPGEYNARPQWDMLLSLRPFVRLTDNMRLIARIDLIKSLIENADSANTTRGQTLLSDFTLTWSVSPIVSEPVTGLKLAGWVDLLAPTSLASQTQTRILTLRGGLGLSKSFDWLNLSYQFRFDYNFNRSKHPAFDVANNAEPPCLGAKTLDSGGAVCGSRSNTQFQFMNRLTAEFVPVERLGITVDFIIYTAFGYEMPEDAFTSANAKPGIGQRDLTAGTFEVSYQVLDELGIALGTTTLQTPKTLDNEGFRFPFFDYRSTSDNLTSFYLDVVATF
ncbi:MAG: hypothetical protein AMXMBFR64_09920 [Myxococcales bacterium]